jgi:hypothetical protein
LRTSTGAGPDDGDRYHHQDPSDRAGAQKPATGGDHYLPDDPANRLHADPTRRDERTPSVALCGPISSVKEQTPHYAERLTDAGYTALTFDPRGFGESRGTPRFRYDPNVVIADYANAVSYR